jgi:hypothetical protein
MASAGKTTSAPHSGQVEAFTVDSLYADNKKPAGLGGFHRRAKLFAVLETQNPRRVIWLALLRLLEQGHKRHHQLRVLHENVLITTLARGWSARKGKLA